jgi:hypothetical protein
MTYTRIGAQSVGTALVASGLGAAPGSMTDPGL